MTDSGRSGSGRVAHASVWAIAGSSTQYATVFVILVYLAHVLEPRDFGLMAAVSIGLDLGLQIARWGQVELLQQQQYRNDAARNRSFRVSLGLGCVFSLAFLVIAAPAGRYLHSHEFALMFYICAPIFMLSGGSVLAEAIMRTEFRFQQLAVRNTVSTLIGGIAAIVLAWQGYGAIALAVQRLVQVGLSTVWVWAGVSWRPSLRPTAGDEDGLVSHGARVMMGSVLPLLVPRSVDFFVGALLGPVQLGLMRVAYRLNDFVGQLVVLPLVSVATAQLSRSADDLEQMRRSYLNLTQASAAMMCPALIGLALVAPEGVPLLFGERWSSSVPLVQILSLLGFVAPINYYFTAAMVSLGKSRIVLRQGAFQVVFGLALAGVAAQYSLAAVVAAHVVRGMIVSLYNVVDLRRYMALSLRRVAASMAPVYASTIVMALAIVLVRAAVGDTIGNVERLSVLTFVGLATYAGALLLGAQIGLWPGLLVALRAIVNRRIVATR